MFLIFHTRTENFHKNSVVKDLECRRLFSSNYDFLNGHLDNERKRQFLFVLIRKQINIKSFDLNMRLIFKNSTFQRMMAIFLRTHKQTFWNSSDYGYEIFNKTNDRKSQQILFYKRLNEYKLAQRWYTIITLSFIIRIKLMRYLARGFAIFIWKHWWFLDKNSIWIQKATQKSVGV